MAESDQGYPDVHCGICDGRARISDYGEQFGVLQASWGYGSKHDGERYRVCLCETCFFMTLAFLRQERRVHRLFDDVPCDEHNFGRVGQDEFWGEF